MVTQITTRNTSTKEAVLAGKSIMQIVPTMNSGGVEQTTLDMANAIVAAGGRAVVVTRGGDLIERLQEMGAKVRLAPVHSRNPVRILLNVFLLSRLIREERIDVIHARSRAPAWSALLAAKLTGKPFVTTYHGVYSSRSALKTFYNSVMARGNVVIANSDFTSDLIQKNHAVPGERIIAIPRGINLKEFDPERISMQRKSDILRAWRET